MSEDVLTGEARKTLVGCGSWRNVQSTRVIDAGVEAATLASRDITRLRSMQANTGS